MTVRPLKGWPAVQVAQKRGERMVERVLPEDPLAFIQRCVQHRQVYWTYHINMRLQGRFISRQHILDAVSTYEVIEAYPQDKYLPSYLVYATRGEEVFHVLFAVDVPTVQVRVITAYRPDSEAWEDDQKTRRRL
jgi:hypothetical protein